MKSCKGLKQELISKVVWLLKVGESQVANF